MVTRVDTPTPSPRDYLRDSPCSQGRPTPFGHDGLLSTVERSEPTPSNIPTPGVHPHPNPSSSVKDLNHRRLELLPTPKTSDPVPVNLMFGSLNFVIIWTDRQPSVLLLPTPSFPRGPGHHRPGWHWTGNHPVIRFPCPPVRGACICGVPFSRNSDHLPRPSRRPRRGADIRYETRRRRGVTHTRNGPDTHSHVQ